MEMSYPFICKGYDFLKDMDNVLIKTMLIELNGIKIAAINGVRFPEIAKVKPTIL